MTQAPCPHIFLTIFFLKSYADGTNLTISGTTAYDIEKILNDELESVHQWLTVNKLTLNDDETEHMIISTY